jgi:hypothetical protein
MSKLKANIMIPIYYYYDDDGYKIIDEKSMKEEFKFQIKLLYHNDKVRKKNKSNEKTK